MTGSDASVLTRRDTSYGWWVCAVLCLGFTFSYMDRALVPLLVQPMERALGLSDTTISLLQGAAFAIFYSLFGFPLARRADNGNRRNLIVFGVIFWCTATICCGLAQTVTELFLARICVAIGEAVLQPAAVSILADYFSPSRRTMVLSVYSMSVYFGGGLALTLGGTLLRLIGPHGLQFGAWGQISPWRVVFVVLGAAGIILVPLLLSVREPDRHSDLGGVTHRASTLADLASEFGKKRAALSCTILGFATLAMAATTMQAWTPTLFVRVDGWTPGRIGQVLGPLTLICGPLGALTGAALANRLQRAGRADAKLLVGLFSASAGVAMSYLVTVLPPMQAVVTIAILTFLIGFNFGLIQAALTELLPNRMRAVASATFIAASNLLSATLGPLLVGILNDHIFHDPMMIAVSLRIVAPCAFGLAAVILLIGLRPYRLVVAERTAGSTVSPSGPSGREEVLQ